MRFESRPVEVAADPGGRPPRRFRVRAHPFLAAFLFLLLPGLVLVATLVAESEWAGARVARLIEERAASRGLELSIGKLALRPWSAEVEVEGVRLAGGPHPLEEATLAHGIVTIERLPLLAGRVRLRAIEAETLAVRIVDDVATAPPPTPGGPDLRPVSALERVHVRDATIAYRDVQLEVDVDARGVSLDGAPIDGGTGGVLGLHAARIAIEGLDAIELGPTRTRFAWRAPVLEITELAVLGPQLSAKGLARVAFDGDGIAVTASAEGAIDLAWAAADLADQAVGKALYEARLVMPPGAPWKLDGLVHGVEGASLEGLALARVRIPVSGGPEGIFVRDGEVETVGGTRATALDFGWDQGAFSLTATLDAAVDEILRWQELPADLAVGRVVADVSVQQRSEGEPLAWRLEGEVEGGQVGADRAPLEGRLRVSAGDEDPGLLFAGEWGGAFAFARMRWAPEGPQGGWTARARVRADEHDAIDAFLARVPALSRLAGVELPEALALEGDGLVELEFDATGRAADVAGGELYVAAEELSFAGSPRLRLEGRIGFGDKERGGYRARMRLATNAAGQGAILSFSPAPAGGLILEVDADDLPIPYIDATMRVFEVEPPLALAGSLDGFGLATFDDAGPQARVVASAVLAMPIGPLARVRLSADVAERGMAVRDLDVRAPGFAAALTGRARWPWDVEPGIEPSFTVDGRVQASLQPLARSFGVGGLVGALDYEGSLTLRDTTLPIHADGRLLWKGLTIDEYALPSGEAFVRSESDGVVIDARTDAILARAALTGAASSPRLALDLDWKDLEIVGFLESLTRAPLGLAMAAWSGGSLDVEGDLLDPASWVGRGEVRAVEVLGPSLDARLEEPAALAFVGEGRVRLDGARFIDEFSDRLEIGGDAFMAGPRAGEIDLRARGTADLQVFEILDADLIARGRASVDLTLRGAGAAPEIDGRLAIEDGRLRWLTLREAIDDLEAVIVFDHSAGRIESGSFQLGGGTVALGGGFEIDGYLPARIDVQLVAKDVAITAPDGVWGRYDAQLVLRGPAAEPEISGSVTMLAGRFTRELSLGFDPWRRQRRLAPTFSLRDWSQNVALRLRVRADHVLALRNDLARAEAALDFEIGGTIAYPLLSGSANVLEGGRLTFRGVEYELYAGQIFFDELGGGPTRLRMRGGTNVAGYSISLEIDATMDVVDYTLRSVPPLPESDILSLLLTGQTLADAGAQATALASSQAATYFGSGLGELLLSGAAKRALGLTEFRIGTARVGPEARPTARVTVGRRLDDRTLVLYSRDLSSEGRDVYRIEHDLTRTLRIGAGRETSGGVATDLRWLYRFDEKDLLALGPAEESEEAPDLHGLEIDGLPESVKPPRRSKLGLSRGGALTRSRAILAVERLRAALVAEGYLETKVRSEIRVERDGFDAMLRLIVEAGPRWEVVVTGPSSAAEAARERLVDLWAGTQFRAALLDEAERVLYDALADDGYATAIVEVERSEAAPRRIDVRIDAGPRVTVGALEIQGVKELSTSDVRDQVLSRPGGALQRTTYRPRTLDADVSAILTLYEAQGFLETTVTPRVRFAEDGKSALLTLAIDEGRRFAFGQIRVEGDWPADVASPTTLIAVKEGDAFTPEKVRALETRLRAALDQAGYFRARVNARPEIADGRVGLTVRVRADVRAEVAGIEIVGLDRSREKIVRRAVRFEHGKPLTNAALQETERELFRLGLFRKVEIDTIPLESDPSKRQVVVRVVEQPPVSLLSSIGYDTEERLRASVSLSHENLFGLARVGSLQVFGSSLRRAARATLEDRHLARGRIEGLISVGPEIEEKVGFRLTRWQGAVQIGRPERSRSRWQLRYQVERTEIDEITLDEFTLIDRLENEGLSRDTEWLAGLIGAYIIDRRDDPFLPTTGWLGRTELGVWAGPLGSDSEFVRWTGQLAAYQPLAGRVSLAASLRVGLGWTFGSTQSIPGGERFFAGGAETVRGFERDRLGPFDPVTGLFAGGGGEAQWIGNLELRFEVYPKIEVALFHDSGNVWATVDALDLGDLRQTYGIGLRWRGPVGLVRAEYGRKIEPRADESSGEWFLSIGEAW